MFVLFCDSCLVRRIHLLMPETYMNVSGNALDSFRAKNPVKPEQILVICDEIGMLTVTAVLRGPPGAIRNTTRAVFPHSATEQASSHYH